MAAVFAIIFFAFSLLQRGTLGELICEDLPWGMCSFSIATSGKRCTLETTAFAVGTLNSLQCKTSEVMVINNSIREYIETDECIKACGVDRNSIGISSDSLLEPQFTTKLCSDLCYNSCPNIVELYFNLALAEGVFLPEMCNKQKVNVRRRRSMSQIRSSGQASTAAARPVYSSGACAPTSGVRAGRVLAESYYDASAPAATENYSGGYDDNEASAPAPV